ncbi:MAG: pantetheine-phosphate adenylyltransferase [Candidatus Marinimicrobia bacterium]|nr:pantetheine-phosphate adenylyltransferase [Candidatus Neomarinimicrobiota bacterium]
MRTVIYPGSFDPVTNGHLDIIERALKLFDQVIIAVAENPKKTPLFTVEERLHMLREATAGFSHVKVTNYSGLTVDFAKVHGACALIRGLRALSDFEAEFQMALINRHMEPDIATVFLMPHDRYTHLNSSIIREIARLGRDVTDFVPPIVINYLREKYNHE